MNQTLVKFGYPQSTVKAYEHWVVVLRPAQITLGSLVLVCTEPVDAFSRVSPGGFAELGRAVADIEAVLRSRLGYARINYLMLMMVDPDVHFHVVPRYRAPVSFDGAAFEDEAWPGPPDVKGSLHLPESTRERLRESLVRAWPAG